ncbi:MAG: GAF and ANTAR domain-containing protein [Actinomycetota bacterium]
MPHDGLEPQRVARVVAALAAGEADPQRSLCRASARVVGVHGAGVVLILRGQALGTVCASDSVAEAIEDSQFTLGEGPCVDAFSTREPVLVPDLAGAGGIRWPGFRERAMAEGVQAVFGFPLLVGPTCIGALNLYSQRTGMLTDDQCEDAATVAYVAGRTVLSWQSVAGEGSLAWQLEHVPAHRAVVHQATGKISVQMAVGVDDALIMLRAYAFAEGRPITAVADDVVAGTVRFDGDAPGQT